jgi:hypothetical protein
MNWTEEIPCMMSVLSLTKCTYNNNESTETLLTPQSNFIELKWLPKHLWRGRRQVQTHRSQRVSHAQRLDRVSEPLDIMLSSDIIYVMPHLSFIRYAGRDQRIPVPPLRSVFSPAVARYWSGKLTILWQVRRAAHVHSFKRLLFPFLPLYSIEKLYIAFVS